LLFVICFVVPVGLWFIILFGCGFMRRFRRWCGSFFPRFASFPVKPDKMWVVRREFADEVVSRAGVAGDAYAVGVGPSYLGFSDGYVAGFVFNLFPSDPCAAWEPEKRSDKMVV
jgi:hypothetical protein